MGENVNVMEKNYGEKMIEILLNAVFTLIFLVPVLPC
jgi:hypothetical protein